MNPGRKALPASTLLISSSLDMNNNGAGIARERPSTFARDYWTQRTLDFMNDVAKGKIMVIDKDTKKARNTDANDVYHEPYDVPYRPDPKPDHDFLNDNNTEIV